VDIRTSIGQTNLGEPFWEELLYDNKPSTKNYQGFQLSKLPMKIETIKDALNCSMVLHMTICDISSKA
jgi:hypothetical protein